jgi:hypothetical protein
MVMFPVIDKEALSAAVRYCDPAEDSCAALVDRAKGRLEVTSVAPLLVRSLLFAVRSSRNRAIRYYLTTV